MFRFLFFILIVLGLALLFAWVADNPGMIFLQWDWLSNSLGRPGEEVGIPVTLALVALVVLVVLTMIVSSLLRGIFGTPKFLSRFFDNRRREKGYRALSKGLIAASAGDLDTARSLTKESRKLLKNEPLVGLLGTQTALLEGDREAATENFKTMLENEDTRMVALRGLFLEAERRGHAEAARHYAEEAAKTAPALPWAGGAKLRYSALDQDWDSAIKTLDANRSAGLIDRAKAKRQRAVLLTAKAMSVEQASPEQARKLAKEAHKLAKDLVPAATTYARAASRLGDIRGAAKVIEASWKQVPHPELADAYATVRVGDSVQDRLKRAKKLAGLKANHPQGSMAVAVAAIDAKEWDEARSALEPVLTTRPTERACLLMADIEEGEHGDQGRMRDWLSRAVRAPADEAWTADGMVSEEWMPVSPQTGEIDAFEWKVPVAQLGEEKAPVMTLEELKAQAAPVVIGSSSLVAASATEKPETPETPEAKEAQATTETIETAQVEEAEVLTEEKPEAKPIVADAETKPAEKSQEDAASDTQASEAEPASSSDDAGETSDKAAEEKAEEPPVDNVVSLEEAKAKNAPEEMAESATKAENGEPVERDKPTAKASASSPYENKVPFPLDRRPDDPGPHPDKEPPKKGFKLF